MLESVFLLNPRKRNLKTSIGFAWRRRLTPRNEFKTTISKPAVVIVVKSEPQEIYSLNIPNIIKIRLNLSPITSHIEILWLFSYISNGKRRKGLNNTTFRDSTKTVQSLRSSPTLLGDKLTKQNNASHWRYNRTRGLDTTDGNTWYQVQKDIMKRAQERQQCNVMCEPDPWRRKELSRMGRR